VFAKELLSAQTAGSTRLPVHPNGFPGRLRTCHGPFRRSRPTV
jgi:hypothetical protein